MLEPRKHFFTRENAELAIITHDSFQTSIGDRLSPTRLQTDTIYEARGSSRQLEEDGKALSFDVAIDRIHPVVETFITYTCFRMLLLDNDYTPIGHRLITMRNDTWKPSSETPFTVHKQPSLRRVLDTIRYGYILEHGDTTLNDLIQTTSTVPPEESIHRQFRCNTSKSPLEKGDA